MSGISPPENYQRVGVLACVPELLRRRNIDPVPVLAAAGLHAQALDNPDGTIPFEAMGRVVEVATKRTECAHFGLEVGAQIHTSALGLLGELMRNSPTLRVALRDFSINQHRNAHGGVVYLFEQEDEAVFGYAIYQPNVAGQEILYDGVALGLANVVRELAGPLLSSVLRVNLSRSEPRDRAPYLRAFGPGLSFNAHQTAVRFPRKLLDQRIEGATAGLRANLEKRVQTTWHAGGLDLLTHLRRELRVALLDGHVSASRIALRMGMTRWTLDRRLKASRLPFQQALDEARCELTQQLLANTRLEIAEIAAVAGYADPSVLTRSFPVWTGMLPSTWRASLGQ